MFAGRQSQLNGRGRLRALTFDAAAAREQIDHEAHRFEAMKDSAPVVVAAHQLFPTPPVLAARVAELAAIEPGHRVLEPSAGTGNLVRAILDAEPTAEVVAVEIETTLAQHLGASGCASVLWSDFLTLNGSLGKFDRIVMNPPFTKRGDIKHIEHARKFLKPGGRLVAICANGPRQREQLKPQADEWHDLPPGSFRESGTNVSAAIAVFEA